jgi:hypothetical protein
VSIGGTWVRDGRLRTSAGEYRADYLVDDKVIVKIKANKAENYQVK